MAQSKNITKRSSGTRQKTPRPLARSLAVKRMNHINRNFAWNEEYSDNSFIGIFHEKNEWNDKEYFKLEDYLFELSEEYTDHASIPRNVFWPTMRIYSYLSHSIGCHLDANDSFKIAELTNEQIYNRRERLQLVFEGFFKGVMPNKHYLGY